MPTTISELQTVQEKVQRSFLEEANAEMAMLIKEKQERAVKAEKKLKSALPELKAAGVDIAKINKLDAKMAKNAEREIEELEKRATVDLPRLRSISTNGITNGTNGNGNGLTSALTSPLDLSTIGVDLLPKGTQVLKPSFGAVITDDDSADTQTGTAQLQSISNVSGLAHVVLPGAGCKNLYNWARGSGSGVFGTGEASINTDTYFGFWFRPTRTRYHSIRPLFKLRGYYILRADDGWFTSKYARVSITCSSRTYQNGLWNGWDHENVLNHGDDNINTVRRFDINRHTYYTSLLAGGDWAYIQCRVRLHAFARGSGSYARNEFSVGSANYLCVPHVHVD